MIASDAAIAYWKAANETDTEEDNVYTNSSYTEKQVVVAEGSDSFDADVIAEAWTDFLSKLTRFSLTENVVTDTMVMGEWTLLTWPNFDELGLTVTKDYYTSNDVEYHYYTFIPDSYTGEEAVPLVVVLHGMSEDPLYSVNGSGWANVAAE